MRGAGALVAALNIHTLESTHVPNALRALINIYKPKNNKIYFVRTVAIRAAGKFTRKEFKKVCLYLDIKHKCHLLLGTMASVIKGQMKLIPSH